jgi:hypothetical protein
MALILVIRSLVPMSAHATTRVAMTVSTVSHGMRLTLIFPGDEHQQGSLIRVQTVIENVSSHPIQLAGTCPPWGTPWVAVLDGTGNDVYPPAVTAIGVKGRTSCSKLYLFKRLSPGARLAATRLVVLRGPQLQMRVMLATAVEYGSQVTKFIPIGGRILLVRLTPASPQAAPVVSSPPLRVAIPMPAAETGPLYYQYVVRCDTAGGTSYPGTWRWQHTSGPTIELTQPAYCSTASEWHVVAGYLNHPVEVVDYSASKG